MSVEKNSLDTSWASDRIIVSEDKLTGDIWSEVKEEDMLWNKALGDAILDKAGFLLIPLTKVARKYKDIFATTLMSSVINSVDEDYKVKAGSLLDKAYELLELPIRVRPRITSLLQAMITGKKPLGLAPLMKLLMKITSGFLKTG